MLIHTAVTFLMTLVLGPAWATQHTHHESGPKDQHAATSALTAETVRQLLTGEGMGLARPAELHQYPGPKHVLELRKELAISPKQEELVEATRQQMLAKATALGRQIVDAERALDVAFASGRITEADLGERVSAIAALQGELRAAHLRAHLLTKPVLTEEQVRQYYRIRGGHSH